MGSAQPSVWTGGLLACFASTGTQVLLALWVLGPPASADVSLHHRPSIPASVKAKKVGCCSGSGSEQLLASPRCSPLCPLVSVWIWSICDGSNCIKRTLP